MLSYRVIVSRAETMMRLRAWLLYEDTHHECQTMRAFIEKFRYDVIRAIKSALNLPD